MKMSSGDATLVNRLLEALLGLEPGRPAHPGDLQLAAETLAARAQETLDCGIGAGEVAERWGRGGLSACIGLNLEVVARLRAGTLAHNRRIVDPVAARRARRAAS